MGIFFVFLILIVQVGFLLLARSMVGSSVDAAARRASWTFEGSTLEEARLEAEIVAAVPGVDLTSVDLVRESNVVTVEVAFRWAPPGPDLLPASFVVRRSRLMSVPP